MAFLDELKDLGVSVEEGLKRLNGNEKLYTRLFGSFLKTLDAKVHTIKGTAGNLSITPLYKGYSEALELLRAGQPKEAKERLEKVLAVQEEIVLCIKKHME